MTGDSPPDKPTRARLEKLIALANDSRGERNSRLNAKRKLALYAKFYPSLVRRVDDPPKN